MDIIMKKARRLHGYERIEITEVDKEDDGIFKVKATVRESLEYYNVTLECHHNMVKKYSCECSDLKRENNRRKNK